MPGRAGAYACVSRDRDPSVIVLCRAIGGEAEVMTLRRAAMVAPAVPRRGR